MLKESEIIHIILAVIVLAIVIGFKFALDKDINGVGIALLFAFIIIIVNIAAKKTMASWLDSDVEHKLWFWQRYGLKPGWHLERSVPIGIILPIFITAFSLGAAKLMTILTYDTKALKRRAARRHGFYSYTEMTDWHNALIGGAGIIAMFFLSFISYWVPSLEYLARMTAFYAFWNMIPLGKLDGIQIYLGSRILWYTLAIFTLIFSSYALFLV
jgi:hypothetical protein